MIYRITRIELCLITILSIVAGGLSAFVGMALGVGRPDHAAMAVVLVIVILGIVFRINADVLRRRESIDPVE